MVHDVTELAEAKRLLDVSLEQTLDLEESNQRDGLTGLYNRKYFDEQITQEVQSARRNGRPLTLVMIDIDHFKHVNDTLGHPAGDTVLRSISTQMCSTLRASDSLCRYGGEEFALILPQLKIEHADILLERLRSAVENTSIAIDDSTKVSVTVSMGAAPLIEGVTPGQLVNMADEALFSSKRAGRNCITCYSGKND